MSRVPRLMDRPALDTADDGKNGYDYLAGGDRASFDRDMDDVSVMTDETSEEVSSEKQSKKKNKVRARAWCVCVCVCGCFCRAHCSLAPGS